MFRTILTQFFHHLTNQICSTPIECRIFIGVIAIVLGVSAVAYAESRRAHTTRCHD